MFAVAAVALAGARAMGFAEHPLGHALVASAACLITVAHCANVRCCRDAARARCYRGPLAGNAMVATDVISSARSRFLDPTDELHDLDHLVLRPGVEMNHAVPVPLGKVPAVEAPLQTAMNQTSTLSG
jgi:hypothetical protein